MRRNVKKHALKIIRAMYSYGFTYQEISDIFDLSLGQTGNYLRKGSKPNAKTALKISEIFKNIPATKRFPKKTKEAVKSIQEDLTGN